MRHEGPTVAQAGDRLHRIVDHHLARLSLRQSREEGLTLLFNEAILEEWCDLLVGMLFFQEQKQLPSAAKVSGHLSQQSVLPRMTALPPPAEEDTSARALLDVDGNRIALFEIKQLEGGRLKYGVRKSVLEFGRELVHDFCSCTSLGESTFLLVGGCRQSDPNLKSRDVVEVSLATKEAARVAQLPFGVSSSGAVRVGRQLYVVGGNRDWSVVTRRCLRVDLGSWEVIVLADLNYPSASHSLLEWGEQFVYKFGGVGSCFGEWDLSPYIERYEIDRDRWEVVNPTIRINEHLLPQYRHFSHHAACWPVAWPIAPGATPSSSLAATISASTAPVASSKSRSPPLKGKSPKVT
jgi:hypothetical protein